MEHDGECCFISGFFNLIEGIDEIFIDCESDYGLCKQKIKELIHKEISFVCEHSEHEKIADFIDHIFIEKSMSYFMDHKKNV